MGRGLWRGGVGLHGASGRPGGADAVAGAASRAARLVRLPDAAPPPGGSGDFPRPPTLTVTYRHGGEGFLAAPDRCEVGKDVRTRRASAPKPSRCRRAVLGLLQA
ncbi:peptidase dimerization domain-containing protein [Streptomyces sp. NPDC002788]